MTVRFQAAYIPSWRAMCKCPRGRGLRPRRTWHLPGHGPGAPLLPIGLTAADPFAGGKVSRVASRVREPGTFTGARCPAGTAALDAVLEAYHDPAAVWWGAFTFLQYASRGSCSGHGTHSSVGMSMLSRIVPK